MKPIALVVFAVLARLLWIWPAWVAVALGGGILLLGVVDHVRRELRRRRYAAERETEPDYPAKEIEKCKSRSGLDGPYYRCALEQGHEGPHESDELYRYWDVGYVTEATEAE